MKKRVFLVGLIVFIFLIVTGCNREQMVAEYTNEENVTEGKVAEKRKDKVGEMPQNKSEETSAEKSNVYLKNKFHSKPISKEKRTNMQIYFQDSTRKQKEIGWKKVGKIKEIQERRTMMKYSGAIYVPNEELDPDYYKHLIESGYDEELLKERGRVQFQVDVFSSPEVKKVQLYNWPTTKKIALRDGWKKESWPFYAESGQKIAFQYLENNDVDKEIEIELKVDIMGGEIPWNLNSEFDNLYYVLLLPYDKYKELFGEDKDDKNISGLFGYEVFYVKAKKGKLEKVKRELRKCGVKETADAAYFE